MERLLVVIANGSKKLFCCLEEIKRFSLFRFDCGKIAVLRIRVRAEIVCAKAVLLERGSLFDLANGENGF